MTRADIERVGEWLRVLVAEKERRGRVEVRAFLQMRIDAPEHCSEADALALFHLAGSEYEQLGERCLRWLKFTNLARMAAPGSNVAELEYQMYRAQWCWLIAKAASTVQQHENATVQQHEYAEDWL